jgi:hypothetical protein
MVKQQSFEIGKIKVTVIGNSVIVAGPIVSNNEKRTNSPFGLLQKVIEVLGAPSGALYVILISLIAQNQTNTLMRGLVIFCGALVPLFVIFWICVRYLKRRPQR